MVSYSPKLEMLTPYSVTHPCFDDICVSLSYAAFSLNCCNLAITSQLSETIDSSVL